MTEGDLVMLGDVGAPSALDHPDRLRDNTHGIVAAPVKQGADVVGAICAFDDTPVRLSESALTAFEQLGASGLESVSPPRPVVREADADAPTMVPPAVERRIDAVLEDLAKETAREAPAAPSTNDDPQWEPTLIDRKRGEFAVARELARARREQRQLSLVLFDVSERASQARPREGSLSPDATLQHVVDTFVRAVRQSDLPIRWSGNELLLVLPGLAGVEARAVAERVRAAMEVGGQRRHAVSGGVAELELNEQFGAAVGRARAKVAQALHHGHNRVS
jgi:diguanylate cyclase (GGDEF)-like protein